MTLRLSTRSRDLITFFSTAFAVFCAAWTFLEVGDYFGVRSQWLLEQKGLGLYLIAIHSLLVGALAVVVMRAFSSERADSDLAPPARSEVLADALVPPLSAALKAKDYLEVIRIGAALSRPLFESGNCAARLAIGELVEEAAARVGDERTQMVELIDSIGWSCIELGELERGEKEVRHGLDIAERNQDYFHISKAKRHLGVIHRKRKEYDLAREKYEEARTAAEQISDAHSRGVAIAGIEYALAALAMHGGKHSEALRAIDSAISGFGTVGEEYRLTMAITLKASVCRAKGDLAGAKDLYRRALRNASQSSQRLQEVRCLIGLTQIYIAERSWPQATDHLKQAESKAAEINSDAELNEIRTLRTQIPPAR